jgi:hypothetical protein
MDVAAWFAAAGDREVELCGVDALVLAVASTAEGLNAYRG